jgi:hypothetical protein
MRNNPPTDDTAVYDCHDPEFSATGDMLVWRDDDGRFHTSIIYQPSRCAAEWDLGRDHPAIAPATSRYTPQLRAIGSRFGCYSYLLVQDRSRGQTRVPYIGAMGRRVTVSSLDDEGDARDPFPAYITARPAPAA